MKKILLWIVVGVLAAITLHYVLEPEKDYRQLALGKWYEPSSQSYADVTPDKIVFKKGRERQTVYYELHPEESPMTVDVWRSKDKSKVYRGTVSFKNDNKVEARKIAEPGDKGDYYAEMLNRANFVWERVTDDDSSR